MLSNRVIPRVSKEQGIDGDARRRRVPVQNNKYLKRSRSPTDDGDPKIPKIRVISEIPKYSSQKSNDIFLCDKTKNVCDCHVSAVTSVPHTSALSADGDALMRDGLTPKTHLTPETRRTRAARSLSTVSALTPAESPDGADALSTVHTLKSSNASYVANSNMRGKGRAWLVSAHRGEGSRRGSSRVEQALLLCHLCAARTAAHAQHLSSLCRPTRGAAGREHALSAVGAAAHVAHVALVLGRVKGGSEATKLGRGRLEHRCFCATAGPVRVRGCGCGSGCLRPTYARLRVYLRGAAGRGGDEATEEHLARGAHREVDAARRACNHTRERQVVSVAAAAMRNTATLQPKLQP